MQLRVVGHTVATIRRSPRSAGRSAAMGAVAVAILHTGGLGDEGARHHGAVDEIRMFEVKAGVQYRHLDALAAVARGDDAGGLQAPGVRGRILEKRGGSGSLLTQGQVVQGVGRIAEAAQILQARPARIAHGEHGAFRFDGQDRRVAIQPAQQLPDCLPVQLDHGNPDMLEQHATLPAYLAHVHAGLAIVAAAYQLGLAQACVLFQEGQRLCFRPFAKGHDKASGLHWFHLTDRHSRSPCGWSLWHGHRSSPGHAVQTRRSAANSIGRGQASRSR
ncbi:hypothetical protein D3C76_796750 [compost metagenome]